MQAASLTPDGIELATRLDALVTSVAARSIVDRLVVATMDAFDGDLLIVQLLVRRHLKQVEFSKAVVGETLAERHLAALALTRTVLEGAVALSWAASTNQRPEACTRLHRILAAGFEAMEVERPGLPAREQAFLDNARSRKLKNPPDTRSAMQAMDAFEQRSGGKVHWESHYQHFAFASDYIHAGVYGPGVFAQHPDGLVIKVAPDGRQGLAALRWGLFYFARGVDAIARLAGDNELKADITAAYAELKPLAQKTLDDMLDAAESDLEPGT